MEERKVENFTKGDKCIKLTRVWVGGVSLKQDSGGSIAEWAIHHVGVASDPANVSHTRIHVSRSVVKHILQWTKN